MQFDLRSSHTLHSAKMAVQRAHMSDLDQKLFSQGRTAISSKFLQRKIIKTFWPSTAIDSFIKPHVPSPTYFEYFQTELEAWRLTGKPVVIQTYRDLCNVVDLLRSNRKMRRDSQEILTFFSSLPAHGVGSDGRAAELVQGTPPSVANAIDLTIRLWLMLNVDCDDSVLSSGKTKLVWRDSESLEEFVQRTFGRTIAQSSPEDDRKQSGLLISMNAYKLKSISGFDIVWTDHLADHLLLNDDLGTFSLYHHASVLQTAKDVHAEK